MDTFTQKFQSDKKFHFANGLFRLIFFFIICNQSFKLTETAFKVVDGIFSVCLVANAIYMVFVIAGYARQFDITDSQIDTHYFGRIMLSLLLIITGFCSYAYLPYIVGDTYSLAVFGIITCTTGGFFLILGIRYMLRNRRHQKTASHTILFKDSHD
jgi:hypothetical protein